MRKHQHGQSFGYCYEDAIVIHPSIHQSAHPETSEGFSISVSKFLFCLNTLFHWQLLEHASHVKTYSPLM